MSLDIDHVDDVLADYAFDALDIDERERAARHLAVCPRCAALAASDAAIVGQLSFAAAPQHPPVHVRARLMERVAHEAAPVPPVRRIGAPMIARPARRRLPRLFLAAALVPWVVAVALGIALVNALHTLAPRPALAVAVVSGPRGETGSLAMDPNGTSAFLFLTHMPRLPHSKVYVCWLRDDAATAPEAACTFGLMPRSDDATVIIHTTRSLRAYALIGITMEETPHPAHPGAAFLASGRLR